MADFLRGPKQIYRNMLFVAESEIAVFTFFPFLAGASEDLIFSQTKDPQAHGDNEEHIGKRRTSLRAGD